MVGLKSAVFLSSSVVTVLLVVLVIALTVQTEVSKAQSSCSTSLGKLNQCAPFVVPVTLIPLPAVTAVMLWRPCPMIASAPP
ncbi:hypothetical protein SLA2020_465830 [Shorea laevis]